MLEQLKLSNLALSEQAEVEFTPGMICITGETGAGKSLIVDALSLVLGARADVHLVRQGSKQLDISALFSIDQNQAAQDWLQEQGFQEEEKQSDLILRRVVSNEGKSRAYINGQLVTLTQIRQISDTLVSIHGQHTSIRLMDEGHQLELVDTYGGLQPEVEELNKVYHRYAVLRHKLTDLAEEQKRSALEYRQDRYELEEMRKLDLNQGDYEELEVAYEKAVHQAQLTSAIAGLHNILNVGESNVLSVLSDRQMALENVQNYSPALPPIIAELEEAQNHLQEAASAIEALTHQEDELTFDEIEQRMSKVREFSRRFCCPPQELWQQTSRLEEKTKAFLSLKGQITELTEEVRSWRQQYEDLSLKLTEKRTHVARTFAEAICSRVQTLALPDARFEIALAREEEGRPRLQGRDSVCFMFSANLGQDLQPLSAVASGGELSRLALIIEVLTASVRSTPTLIFDEVDTGISGRTAAAVGALLKELGQYVQVITVTHLPQVAARANTQFVVAKYNDTEREQVNSTITCLDTEGRVEEISRMIGGTVITDITRQSACELLAEQ